MNLYLIGFRGCGKSTVAPLLAETVGWTSVDSDAQIEILTGKTVSCIFEESGEAGFRQWETTIIQAIAQGDQQVVSLGGGAPTIETNREVMKRSGRTVWLTAPAEVLWQRIQADPNTANQRPGLTDLDGYAEVRQLLAQRENIYRDCADYTVETSDSNPQEIADRIANWWDPVDT